MRKHIEQRIKEQNMAKNHFDDDITDDKQVSFGTFLFVTLAAFYLGMSIAQYQAHKHLKDIKPKHCKSFVIEQTLS